MTSRFSQRADQFDNLLRNFQFADSGFGHILTVPMIKLGVTSSFHILICSKDAVTRTKCPENISVLIVYREVSSENRRVHVPLKYVLVTPANISLGLILIFVQETLPS